jgi:hypothetical protein
MKFKNPQGKEIGAFGTVLAGVVIGAMLSDGVVSLIHTPTAGADATTAKKEETMLLAKRGAIIVASGYAGAGISGTDTTSVLAKSACYGMAGKQTINVVSSLAGKNAKLADTSTKAKRFIASTLGLACPDASSTANSWMNGSRSRKRHALRIPAAYPLEVEQSPLDAIYAEGASMAQS